MMFGRKHLTALLILMINVFRAQTLTCPRGEYQISDECCPMCPAGMRVKRDCTEFRTTSCLRCLEGTFMNQLTGRRLCFPCSSCNAASGLKTKTSCTSTSDAVCEPLEGFYCVNSAEDDCEEAQKHTSCRPGQYIRLRGTASTDTDCSDCSDGTYSDGTFTSCQQHTQCDVLLKAGTASADAECGGQSSHVSPSRIAIIVLVYLLIVIPVSGLVIFFKRKKLLNAERTTAGNQQKQHPAGEEETETLNTTCPQQVEAVDT